MFFNSSTSAPADTHTHTRKHIMFQEDIYLQSYPFTTAAAIIGFVDRKVCATLVDGRSVIGVLRTFDQFGNLVIHDGVERLYRPETKQYAESTRSQIYVIRGENLLMIGDVDIDIEDDAIAGWERIDFAQTYLQFKKDTRENKAVADAVDARMTQLGAYVK